MNQSVFANVLREDDRLEDLSAFQHLRLKIPSKIDLEAILCSLPTVTAKYRGKGDRYVSKTNTGKQTFQYLKNYKHLDKAYLLLDTIRLRMLEMKHGDTYARVSVALLNKIVNHKTRRTIETILESAGIIKIGPWSYFGKGDKRNKCKGYLITDSYWSEDLSEFKPSYKLLVKIYKSDWQKTHILLGSSEHPEYKAQMNQFFETPRLIDTDQAMYIAELVRLAGEHGVKIDERDRLPKKVTSFSLKKMDRRYKKIIDSIGRLDSGIPQFKISSKVDRVSTSITNSHRILKSTFLDKEGNSMYYIDFSCSHTFHLVYALEDLLTPEERSSNNSYPNIVPLPSKHIKTQDLLNEVAEIKSILISNGTIYDYIAEQYLLHFGKPYSENKDENKAMMKEYWNMHFLCSKHPNWGITKWIKSLYPNISAYNEQIGKKRFASMLLRSEAYLMNNLIMREVATSSEFKDATYFTQFDAIMIDKKHSECLWDIMYLKAFEYFGFTPELKGSDLALNGARRLKALREELLRRGVSLPQEPSETVSKLFVPQGQLVCI